MIRHAREDDRGTRCHSSEHAHHLCGVDAVEERTARKCEVLGLSYAASTLTRKFDQSWRVGQVTVAVDYGTVVQHHSARCHFLAMAPVDVPEDMQLWPDPQQVG